MHRDTHLSRLVTARIKKWNVSHQSPIDRKELNDSDITENLAAADVAFIHVKFHLPEQKEELVIDTAGIVTLSELLARSYIDHP